MKPFKDCEQGWHATLVELAPVFLGACVNVLLECPRCHTIVMEDSYTREAWDARQRKRGAAPRDDEPRLPF